MKLKKGVIEVSKLLDKSFSGSNVKYELFESNTIVVEEIETKTKSKEVLIQQKFDWLNFCQKTVSFKVLFCKFLKKIKNH